MRSHYFFIWLVSAFILMSGIARAQKNAPLAGEAAQLVDLLKKDYSAIDPTLVDEELVKDRAQVISIFKNYLQESQKQNLKAISTSTTVTHKKYAMKLDSYKMAQKALSAYLLPQNPQNISQAQANQTVVVDLANKSEVARKAYYKARYEQDSQQLGFVKRVYEPKNKYVAYMIDQFIDKYSNISTNLLDLSAKSNPNASVQKGIPFLGGNMGFEVVIEGLSKFLAKRIKEELTTEVIDKVKDWLKNPKKGDPLAELKVLLPRTNSYLLDFTPSQVANFPNEIKQYIEDDLNHLIENMTDLKNTPRIKQLIENHPDCEFAMEALEIIPTLSKVKDPIDYFDAIENSRNISRWKQDTGNAAKFNIGNTLHLSAMLAHSFGIIDNGQTRFAGSDFMANYSADLNFYLLYVGFLRQQNLKYYDVSFMLKTNDGFKLTTLKDPSGTDLADIPGNNIRLYLSSGIDQLIKTFDQGKLDKLNDDRRFFGQLFTQIGEHSEKVYNTALDIRKANKKGSRIGADTVHTFVKGVIDLAEEITEAGDTLVDYLAKKANVGVYNRISSAKIDYSDTIPIYTVRVTTGAKAGAFDLKSKTAPYFKLANATNDVAFDLQNRKYATALLKAMEATADLLPDKFSKTTGSLVESINLARLTAQTIQDGAHAEDWKRILSVLDDLKTTKAFSAGKNEKTCANVIYDELIKIRLYQKSFYGHDSGLMVNLASVIKVTLQMQNGSFSIDSVDSVSIKRMIADPKFQRLVVSYYAQEDIDTFLLKLEKELKEAVVEFKEKTIRIFEDADIADIKTAFYKYEDVVFSYLKTADKNKLDKANENLGKTITAYLQRLPGRIVFIPENTRKIIHFVNDMAVSQNSEDIEKAIEAFALPAGSYSIKRESRFNATINSFPGLLPSLELIKKSNVTYGNFSPAFTVPVGFCFARGTRKGFSHGIFVPVIDIGAVTRMHLDGKDSTYTMPEFNFMSVFSPGIYYHLGLKKTAFSINIGAQYGPGLREINPTGETKVYESVRFGVAFVFDIPLLNLTTKPRFEQ